MSRANAVFLICGILANKSYCYLNGRVYLMADKRNNGRKRKRIALSFGIEEATGRRAFTEDISPLGDVK
jgi:hypothetical protein